MKFSSLVLTVAVAVSSQVLLTQAQAQNNSAEEQQAVATLQSDKSPHDKDLACATLKRIGTEASIPALAVLLTDEQLSHSARYALESMPSPKAGQALADALAKTTGSNQVGIIDSLGERADKVALVPLVTLLHASDPLVAAASAEALGKIGGAEAQKSLDAVVGQTTGSVHAAVDDALLRCATASRDHEEFHKLYQSETNVGVRIAAYRGMIQTEGDQALQLVTDGITGTDIAAQTASLQMARELTGNDVTPALTALLPNAKEALQIALIGVLDQRGDPAAAATIMSLTAQASSEVRLACISALDNIGGASAVPTLAILAASGGGAEKKAARAALLDLRREDITGAMLKLLPSAEPAEQMELAHALGERGDTSAVPELMKLATAGSDSSKTAAMQALALLCKASDLPALVDLVAKSSTDDARSSAADALGSVLQRLQSVNSNVDLTPLVQAIQNGKPETRIALLPVCSGIPGEQSRQVLRSCVSDADANVKAVSVRAMCDTHDPQLMPDLLNIIDKPPLENSRTLAVRGAIELATQEENSQFSTAQKVDICKQILAKPLDVTEKRAVLAGLATIHDKQALELTMTLIDDKDVHAEAAQAAEAETPHQFRKIKLTDQFWDEGANFADFNHDGKMDVVSGPFWYEGPAFTRRHEYRAAKASFEMPKAGGGNTKIPGFVGALGTNNAYSDDFLTFTYDFNNDGWPDILVIDFPGKGASWYENPKGEQGHWKSHEIAETVDNESPTFLDINGDGKPEIVCNAKGYFGYYAPTNWNEAVSEAWAFHPITPKGSWHKFTHGLGVGDVNGDCKMDLLEKDGWWEQPASLAGDPVWTFHPFAFAPGDGTHGAAQMFAYDVNGDGLNDVITSLDPHGYGLVWWEQLRKGTNITFKQHVIMGKDEKASRFGAHFSQDHSMALADIDGDGLLDIVTGKRYWAHGPHGPDPESDNFPAVLYWFQLVRHGNGEAEFVPHLIDSDSGVGTQVVVGNIVNPNLPDIVVGNKKGTFVFVHEVEP